MPMVIVSMRFLPRKKKKVQELCNLYEVSEEFYFARFVTLCYFGWVYPNNKVISNTALKIFVLFPCPKLRALPIILQIYQAKLPLLLLFLFLNVFALSIPSWNCHSEKHNSWKISCIWWKQDPGMLSSRMHASFISLFVLWYLLTSLPSG